MKIRYKKVSAWLITTCLSALGFTSCNPFEVQLEYGTPNANYSVKGVVTDEANRPIPGIQVTIGKQGLPHESFYDVKTMFTAPNGMFTKSYVGEFPRDLTFELTFEDIDGAANGEFKTKSESVVIKTTELKDGDKRWFKGSATKEITIKLESK
jgi:putative lipoprotein (rSAM/lipoprotein system)